MSACSHSVIPFKCQPLFFCMHRPSTELVTGQIMCGSGQTDVNTERCEHTEVISEVLESHCTPHRLEEREREHRVRPESTICRWQAGNQFINHACKQSSKQCGPSRQCRRRASGSGRARTRRQPAVEEGERPFVPQEPASRDSIAALIDCLIA